MSGNEQTSDATFYQLIHQLTGTGETADDSERRGKPRHAFPSVQRIAPRLGRYLPAESEFFEVQCHDLNGGGFSYLARQHPQYDSLVVALGDPPNYIYLVAKITHCSQVIVYPSGVIEPLGNRATHASYESPEGERGRLMVRVGCRFTQRLTERDA